MLGFKRGNPKETLAIGRYQSPKIGQKFICLEDIFWNDPDDGYYIYGEKNDKHAPRFNTVTKRRFEKGTRLEIRHKKLDGLILEGEEFTPGMAYFISIEWYLNHKEVFERC